MMASIPNMRSTPLPVPTPRTAAAEVAPGEFAKKMPAPPEQPVIPVPIVAQPPVGEIVPHAPGGDTPASAGEDSDDTSETKAAVTPQPTVMIVQPLPIVPGPQVLPQPVSAEDAPKIPAATQAVAPESVLPGRPGRNGKTSSSAPALADLPKDQAATPELDAAVKELLQRKQILAKAVAATQPAPADNNKADAARADAAPAPTQAPAAPAAVHAAAPVASVDLPQPVLAALDTQPAPLKAAGNVDAPRAAGLPTEKQLDISRDTAWLDRLARDIASAGANDAPLRFRLHPQTLGHLQVELQQGDHGTSVRLTVETEAARNILTDAQPRLAAEARAQGVRIAETHVDLGGSGREATGDRRRQDDTRQNPLIRTVHSTGADGIAAARSSDRTRLDRYA
jgi:flagellar hook-length control protein FliK